jgi:hypothetical protein
MLGDISDPQLLAAGTSERAIDEVECDGVRLLDPRPLSSSRNTFEARTPHYEVHLVAANVDASANGEPCLNADAAVVLSRSSVDPGHNVGEPRVADRVF